MNWQARTSVDGPARRQLQSWLGQDRDAATATRLASSEGLWAALREAARAGDTAFLDELAELDVASFIDDELPAFPGATAKARALALHGVARLAADAAQGAAPGVGRLLAGLERHAAAFTPAGHQPWSPLDLRLLPLEVAPGQAALRELVGQLVRSSGHPGLVVVADLLDDIDGATIERAAAPASRHAVDVRVVLAGAQHARIARLRTRTVEGTLGLYHDAARAPFQRWDATFERAVQRAWWAAGQPALAVRWSLDWEDSGEPVELVEGPSAGVAMAFAVARLQDGPSWPLDDRWLFTGAIDESGAAVSLLEAGDQLSTAYRDKVQAAAGGVLVVPAADADALRHHATRRAIAVEVLGVAQLDELHRHQPDPDHPAAPGAHLDIPTGTVGAEAACPYKGLAFFTADDAAWFHGRERVVAQLVNRLRSRYLVGVVGPSGAGKSSLVRAGLLPALARGAIPGSGDWRHAVVVPGSDIWPALARALDPLLDTEPTNTEPTNTEPTNTEPTDGDSETDDAAHAARWLRRLRGRAVDDAGLVIVFDQFEELFTLAPPEQVAPVLHLLAELSEEAPSVRMVVVIRADYYANVISDEHFAELLSHDHVLVGPMSANELRRAITAPARSAGLRLEPALVDVVFDDVVDQPAALPYLSVALRETWARRDGDTLTLDGYLASGGVAHAIARLADDLVDATPAPSRAELQALFLRLLETGDNQQVVRRRAPLDELSDAQRGLLPDLLDRRLLVADGRHVELAHDSLVMAWPTLREWLAEQYDDVRLHIALANRSHEWAATNRSDDLLERGSRLERFGEMARRRPAMLNDAEHDFIRASERAEGAETARRQAAALRTRRLLVATSVALVVALLGATVALVQRNRAADREREVELARSLQVAGQQAARAQAVLSGDSRALAALLSLAALEAAPNFEAVAGLAGALSSFTRPIDTHPAHADDLVAASLSADGARLATGSWDRTVRIWDTATLREELVLRGAEPAATHVAFAPDGHAVVGALCDTSSPNPCEPTPLRVWSLEPGASTEAPTAEWATGYGDLAARWVDDQTLVVAHREGVSSWSEDGAPVGSLVPASLWGAEVWTVAAGPERLVAAGATNGQVRWWRLGQDPATARQAEVGAHVRALAFSHDGSMLAVSDETGRAHVLDVATGTSRFDEDALRGSEDEPFRSLVFSPDDTLLLAGGGSKPVRQGGDNDLRLWSMDNGLQVRRFAGASDIVQGAGFRADGRIVAASTERRIRVFESVPTGLNWHISDQRNCAGPDNWWITETGNCWLTSVSVLPDSERFLTAGWDGELTMWDAATRQPLAVASDPGASGAVPNWNWAKRMALSPDGLAAATPTDDGGVQLWTIDPGSRTPTLTPGRRLAGDGSHSEDGDLVKVNVVGFSPDGSLLAAAHQDGSVRLWEVADGTLRWRGQHGPPTWSLPTFALDISFSPDGSRLITPGGDARLRVWSVADGRELATSGELSYVQTVAQWSPDGTTVFSGGADGVLRVWDRDLKLRREFSLGVTALPSAAFTADSSLLIVTDQERVVRVLDLDSGRQLAAFPVPFEPLQATVTADGEQILVTDKGGSVYSYVGPDAWARAACALSERNLSQAEWDGFVGADRPYVRLCPDLPPGPGADADAPTAANLEANIAASLRSRANTEQRSGD